jgi:hypothetical protein
MSDYVYEFLRKEALRLFTDEGFIWWYDRYEPTLDCTPRQAVNKGNQAKVLEVIHNYLDPSYT